MARALVVAESSFFADEGDGVRKPVRVRIFMPVPDGRSFACGVEVSGVVEPTRAYGEDSMQALALGVRFVNNALVRRHAQGWRYYLENQGGAAQPIWRFWGHSPRLNAFHIPGDPQ